MAKTKFRIKLTGLEIEFEGEREDLPRVTGAMQNQFSEIMKTPSIVAPTTARLVEQPRSVAEPSKSPRRKSNGSGGKRSRSKEPAVQCAHDAARWGMPLQTWNPTNKTIWLLYVVMNETDIREMSASRIATTFNEHFREAGKIQASNVSRDLNKAKALQPALVQEDTNESPARWYLTDAGKKAAAQLVEAALDINT